MRHQRRVPTESARVDQDPLIHSHGSGGILFTEALRGLDMPTIAIGLAIPPFAKRGIPRAMTLHCAVQLPTFTNQYGGPNTHETKNMHTYIHTCARSQRCHKMDASRSPTLFDHMLGRFPDAQPGEVDRRQYDNLPVLQISEPRGNVTRNTHQV